MTMCVWCGCLVVPYKGQVNHQSYLKNKNLIKNTFHCHQINVQLYFDNNFWLVFNINKLMRIIIFLIMFCRYNPEHLSTLEKYVEVQCAENVYDLEANLAVLKLYQFHQNYNMKITSQILLKALTNFPHTDFILCKCLLSKDLVSFKISRICL